MLDRYQRTINYLRMSVTDKCNLRCIYCIPNEHRHAKPHKEELATEQIIQIAKASINIGVQKIRITGGEPLIRPGIIDLVHRLKEIPGLKELSLTTNGALLFKLAASLAEAGLDRINVSLDSLEPTRYRELTRGGSLNHVLDGINEAMAVGFNPIKINNVPIRGLNDDEIENFAMLTINTPLHVRFIELMPIGPRGFWSSKKCVPVDEIMSRAETLGTLTPCDSKGNGPARYFKYPNAKGVVGFISPVTYHFCYQCNRLRLTCDGKIRPCLFSDDEVDLKPAFNSPDVEQTLQKLLELSIQKKPKEHGLAINGQPTELKRTMSEIGG
jgi:cyclic pyranopterin phosphate synthase